jgi:adhesin/invasin
VDVAFSVSEGGGAITGAIQTTDADGTATVGGWSLGTSPGVNRLQARVGGVVTTWSATAEPGPVDPAMSLIVVADDSVEAGGTTVITLHTRDEFGNPAVRGGAAVAFNTSGGTSTGQISATIDVGDGTYTTTFTGLTAGSPTTIGATIDGDPVTSPAPTITVGPGPPSRLALTAGDGQQATVGTAVPVAPTVTLFDAAGNPIAGTVVTFEVTGGGGRVTDGTQVTDSAGRATVGAWTLGEKAGENLLTAATQSAQATVTAVATPGPVSPTASQVVVPQDTVAVGESVGVLVQAYDAFGNVTNTRGETVTFFLEGGTSGGSFGPTVDRGDGTYVALFTAVTPGTPALVRALIGGIEATTPSPTLTVRGQGTRWKRP